MIARIETPNPATSMTDGSEALSPPSHGTVASMHGFMLSYAAVPRPFAHTRPTASPTLNPKTLSMAVGSGLVRPLEITVYIGISTMNCNSVGRQPPNGLTPRDL